MSKFSQDPFLRKEQQTVQLIMASKEVKEALASGHRVDAETIVAELIQPLGAAFHETLEIAVRGAGVTAGDFLGSDYHKILEKAGLIWFFPGGSYWPTQTGTFVHECLMLLKSK